MVRRFFSITGVVAIGTLAASAQSGDTQAVAPKPVVIHTGREFKGMCRRAKTADEFGALSTWCAGQSSASSKKVAQLEAELKQYYSGPTPVGPKYPPRDQTLKELISHYRLVSAKWQERAKGYTDQQAKLKTKTLEATR